MCGQHLTSSRVVVVVVVSHIQRIGCQPKKQLYTLVNPARGLLNRGGEKKKSESNSILVENGVNS